MIPDDPVTLPTTRGGGVTGAWEHVTIARLEKTDRKQIRNYSSYGCHLPGYIHIYIPYIYRFKRPLAVS